MAFLILAVGPGGPPAAAAPPQVYEVCHRPPDNPGNYRTLLVSPGGLATHLAHGDLTGPCSANCEELCSDGNQCTTDSDVWDAGRDRCTCSNPQQPDGTPCDDGNSGTSSDVCVAGVCTGGLPLNCKALHDAGATTSGVYWLSEPQGVAYQAYCDMTTDGGGWTAVFVGKNGSANVFDHFDEGTYTGSHTDLVNNEYLRRAPLSLSLPAELLVSCDTALVKASLTPEVLEWLTKGKQLGWQLLPSTVIAGSVDPPNFLFTGDVGGNSSFVYSFNQRSGPFTFAASFNDGTQYDYCHGSPDQTSLVRIFYR